MIGHRVELVRAARRGAALSHRAVGLAHRNARRADVHRLDPRPDRPAPGGRSAATTARSSCGRRRRWKPSGRLAGGVAHDFNNVLTAIFGYADLLLDGFAAGRSARRRRRGDQARRAIAPPALTRQLLAFSRKQVMQPRRLESQRDHRQHSEAAGEADRRRDRARASRPIADLGDVKADPGRSSRC